MHPADGRISQEVFDPEQASGQPWPHTGRDYAVNLNAPIRTISDGVVIYAGNGAVTNALATRFMLVPGSLAGGNYVFIQHEGWIEYFGHLNRIDVKTGQAVRRGQTIGGAGETGNARGVHLHYEVIVEPCPSIFPWGRYHPQLQINWEDANEKGDTDMALSAENIALIQKMHTVTREWLDSQSQKQHDVTRKFVIDSLGTQTQAQQDVTREYLADRVKESSDPEYIAQQVTDSVSPELAKQVAVEIGKKLSS